MRWMKKGFLPLVAGSSHQLPSSLAASSSSRSGVPIAKRHSRSVPAVNGEAVAGGRPVKDEDSDETRLHLRHSITISGSATLGGCGLILSRGRTSWRLDNAYTMRSCSCYNRRWKFKVEVEPPGLRPAWNSSVLGSFSRVSKDMSPNENCTLNVRTGDFVPAVDREKHLQRLMCLSSGQFQGSTFSLGFEQSQSGSSSESGIISRLFSCLSSWSSFTESSLHHQEYGFSVVP